MAYKHKTPSRLSEPGSVLHLTTNGTFHILNQLESFTFYKWKSNAAKFLIIVITRSLTQV